MKFPRTTRLFRGQFDLGPFLCVLFPLAFVGLFHGFLVLPRGSRLTLPSMDNPTALGAGAPAFVVAVDHAERLYFENQLTTAAALETALAARAGRPGAPQTLLVQADQAVPYGKLTELAALAQRSGLRHVVFGSVPPHRP